MRCRNSASSLCRTLSSRRRSSRSAAVLRKNLMVLSSHLLFMPPFFPIGIRDADHPGQSSPPHVGHTEFGDRKFPAPECLLMVRVCPALGRNAGGPCCNEPPIP